MMYLHALSKMPGLRMGGQAHTAVLRALGLALAGLFAISTPASAQTTQEILAFVRGATGVATIIRPSQPEAIPPQRLGRAVIPDACRETLRLHGRNLEMYHAGCIETYGYHHLPSHCDLPVRTEAGTRRYFVAHCVFEANYRSQTHWYAGRLIWDSPGPERLP
jgi:hypothetical protein